MFRIRIAASLLSATLLAVALHAADPLKVLVIDGQNNHKWQETTPVLKRVLEETGRFQVDVATSPPTDAGMSGFRPRFAGYDVVLSNYNGQPWSAETSADFERYVRGGGGFVSYHAADNAFPDWKQYNEMIAVGGWGGRTEKHGPSVRWYGDGPVLNHAPGRGGRHGKRHPFQIIIRNANHPITAGLPNAWMHAVDELYDTMRGPAKNMNILATAFSDPGTRGTGHHEPMLLTVSYGQGRVFHTTLGHDVEAMRCVGFITTLQRGTEWAATGKVTLDAPTDFPSASKVSVRD
ncbi:MAG: ThuA domain-containing protein [bacterium]|nr:ThuA domain-containing protein [bacterium]